MPPCDDRNTNPANEITPSSPTPVNSSGTPTFRYTDLSQSSNEVLIEHEGQLYRLRMTRNGKLILNK
ncbi:hemin uptake protein HemP [Schlesneria paludicola]|uniref:hemin uptake protein HemP n=1 Tax=Schlesneria paludicola TaxID=360056 RepID=UPI000A05A690|nr:hemin uptake protein HemP [Schlesneria paludicola]